MLRVSKGRGFSRFVRLNRLSLRLQQQTIIILMIWFPSIHTTLSSRHGRPRVLLLPRLCVVERNKASYFRSSGISSSSSGRSRSRIQFHNPIRVWIGFPIWIEYFQGSFSIHRSRPFHVFVIWPSSRIYFTSLDSIFDNPSFSLCRCQFSGQSSTMFSPTGTVFLIAKRR